MTRWASRWYPWHPSARPDADWKSARGRARATNVPQRGSAAGGDRLSCWERWRSSRACQLRGEPVPLPRSGLRARARTSSIGPGQPRPSSRTPASGTRRRSWSPGASAYRDGEFLYQDFLYDDHGAKGELARSGRPATRQATPSRGRTAPTRTRPTRPTPTTRPTSSSCGSSRWPTRRPSGITLNTMKDPRSSARRSRSAARAEPRRVPPRRQRDRARRSSSSPFTAHTPTCSTRPPASPSRRPPTGDDLDRAAARSRCASRTRPGTPATRTVRLAAGVGLWDTAAGRYLIPGAAADATHPGRRRRARQPDRLLQRRLPLRTSPASTSTRPTPCSPTRAWWRDRAQGDALASGDLEPVPRRRRLRQARAAASTDDMRGKPDGVPTQRARWTGSSRATSRPSRAPTTRTTCGQATRLPGRAARPAPAVRDLRARTSPPPRRVRPHPAAALAGRQLQPVLRQPQPVAARRAGPGLDRDHPRGPRARTAGTTATPGADTFEVWADVARRYRSIPRWTAISGLLDGRLRHLQVRHPVPGPVRAGATRSSGPPGLGVWVPPAAAAAGRRGEQHEPHARLGAEHPVPDLGRRPRTSWCPWRARTAQAQTFDDLGYRYVFDLFTTADHFALAVERPVRAGGRLPRHHARRPQPGARHLRRQPDDGLRRRRHGRRPRLLAVGPEPPRRQRERAPGAGRRPLGGLRPRRPGRRTRPRPRPGHAPGRQPRRRSPTASDRKSWGPAPRRPRSGTCCISTPTNLAQRRRPPGAGAPRAATRSSTSPPTAR